MTDNTILVNNFATRCFRNTADYDYIAARLCYRNGLYKPFQWQALQAIEKYLKAILLYNRVPNRKPGHSLIKLLDKTRQLPFEIRLCEQSRNLIKHLESMGRFRYLETSYFLHGFKLLELDLAVWEVRRYCQVLDATYVPSHENAEGIMAARLREIEESASKPYTSFKLENGALEQIIQKKDDPKRKPLLWQNACFGSRSRKTVSMASILTAVNAPLTLHPEVLEDVLRYIYLPKDVIEAYRELNNQGED